MLLKAFYLFLLSVYVLSETPFDNGINTEELLKSRKPASVTSEEVKPDYWHNQAKTLLQERLSTPTKTGVAKNVILFIGDGMSIPTLAAARTLKGQRENKLGEETQLSFEKFAYSGLAKTYCIDKQAADGACSATALLTGAKVNSRTLGVAGTVAYKDYPAALDTKNHLQTIARLSQLQGKRTGLVTTTTVTHATPAALYANTANRYWENDLLILLTGHRDNQCKDIADQLVSGETGKNLNVILGGGRTNFIPLYQQDEQGNAGSRIDGRNLIKEWELRQNGGGKYVYDREGLLKITKDDKNLLGLFGKGHLPYNLDRDANAVPSLTEMTQAAIKVLTQDNQNEGFFLLVEGGRIDHAHARGKARKALDETLELDKAVEAALQMTSSDETLIVVTADHSETMTFNGNAERGNDVLGLAGKADDDLPYASISYATAITGYKNKLPRNDLSKDDLSNKDYRYPALAPRVIGAHGAEDVSVHAQGPGAHLLSGVVEQSYIAHVLAYASCVGSGVTACSPPS